MVARDRSMVFAALFAGASAAASAQQPPVYGCGAAVSCAGPRGFSTDRVPNAMNFLLTGRTRDTNDPRIRLTLPPPPEARDIGAIEASAEIVLGRNRKLRENLAVAQAAAAPLESVPPSFDGEVQIRVVGRPFPPAGDRRRDVPKDAFAAMPLRRSVYPQFASRS